MDRNRFDALTRVLGAEGSRRAALGTMLGAAFLGNNLHASAKKKNRKKKKKNPPQPCFGTKDCPVPFPSDGQDFEDCNLAGAFLLECNGCNFRGADLGGADLSIVGFQGASFREANLRGANLEDADVSGASFRDACLVDASFLDANTDGAHFGDAILCNTVLPDGSIDNSGCDDVTDCCPPAECAGGSACNGTCCEFPCSCVEAVPGPGVSCVDTDVGDCDFPCVKDPDCPDDWLCIDDGFCGFDHCHPACGVDVEVQGESRRGASHRR